MIQRQIVDTINILCDKFPVIALTGPRQSGKTTLLKNTFPDYQYVSLEDPGNCDFAHSDPKGFLKLYSEKVIFDEVQRVPHLFSYIQTIVDTRRQMGKFILSGSQNFQLSQNITQSLAGRVALFKLLPFDFTELKNVNLLTNDYPDILIKGAYPALYDRQIPSDVFYANYIQTYVERDAVELIHIRDLRQFRAFLGLCAVRVGQLLNISALANECGISQPTAKAWLSILESSYITFQLPPYFKNFSKRIVKSPKLYFYDTGLVCHLLGIKTDGDLVYNPLKSSLFENLIVAEFHKQNEHRYQHMDFYFWRDSNGNEVDLLRPHAMTFDIFEIKSSQTIMSDQFKGLKFLQEIAQEAVAAKTLIYGGNEIQYRSHYTVLGWNQVSNY
ncbi:ATP-binding protein [Runella sp.]|uniref:ATP-binding protein n=1 Tax=Runella sp. TaxID=1960881 RepID=UPI003D11258B